MSVPGLRPVLSLCLLLLIAVALQATLSARWYLFGGQPDFIFVVIVAAALLSDAGLGALLGLSGGLLTAALVGETVGTFLVSRTIGGFIAGWISGRLFRVSAGVVLLSGGLAFLMTEVVYVLAAPRVGLESGLRSALIGTVWNALLAIPVTALLRRLGWGEEPD